MKTLQMFEVHQKEPILKVALALADLVTYKLKAEALILFQRALLLVGVCVLDLLHLIWSIALLTFPLQLLHYADDVQLFHSYQTAVLVLSTMVWI